MDEPEKLIRSVYSPTGSGELPEYAHNVERGRSLRSRFVDSFKKDPNAHATPTGAVGGDGRVFDVETAAQATASSPLIAIGGSIGTGLFVGSGSALAHGGPASLTIAFALIGIMMYCTVHALGEMAVLFPISGSFAAYSTRFLDPAWGFAMGWK
jgi:amino acid transporter